MGICSRMPMAVLSPILTIHNLQRVFSNISPKSRHADSYLETYERSVTTDSMIPHGNSEVSAHPKLVVSRHQRHQTWWVYVLCAVE